MTQKKKWRVLYNFFTICVFSIIILCLFKFYKREFSRLLLREIIYSQIRPDGIVFITLRKLVCTRELSLNSVKYQIGKSHSTKILTNNFAHDLYTTVYLISNFIYIQQNKSITYSKKYSSAIL